MIVLTGAAGSIGWCYLWKLNQEGYSDIILVDEKLTPQKEKNLANKNFKDFIDKDSFLELVKKDIKPSKIMTKNAFENAIRVDMTMGGSTNAVLHIPAIARELGIDIDVDTFDKIARETPNICKIIPAGEYEMADLDKAGGIPAVLNRIKNQITNKPFDEDISCIMLDFRTIQFLANDVKKHSGFDEICLNNDMPYDIVVSYQKGMQDACSIEQYHRKRGITLEPRQHFHKTVNCTHGKSGVKRLHALGLLVMSIAMAESSRMYTIPYSCRIYSHSSLIGNKGWKTVTLSANTIKWFNNGFSVSCSSCS